MILTHTLQDFVLPESDIHYQTDSPQFSFFKNLGDLSDCDGRVVRLVSGLCRPCSGRVSGDQGTLTKMCP